MANIEKSLSSLQKLYANRAVLDRKITDAEKKLVAEAKAAIKAVPAKTSTARKKQTTKKRAAKPVAKK